MTRTLLCFGDSNTYGTPPIHALTEPHRRLQVSRFEPSARLLTAAGLIFFESKIENTESKMCRRTADLPDGSRVALNGRSGRITPSCSQQFGLCRSSRVDTAYAAARVVHVLNTAN